MQIRSLEALGIAGDLLGVWEREYGSDLLPAQAEVVGRTSLLRGGSLLLSAPTGAGKTLVGEMAALHAATSGRRALFLVPTKALAEEKYALLSRLYAPLGLRVLISTRDRRRDDPRLQRGDFDLAVAVPEKAHYLFSLSPTAARALGCVVVDELQLLGDLQRGPGLEVTLAHLRAACPRLQIVGLSAVLGLPGELANWLGAEWFEVTRRPVELRRGVFAAGVFRYQEYNTGQFGEEHWPLDLGESDWETAATHVALWLASRGEPTLLFLPDRPSVVRLALRLAEEADSGPALAPTPASWSGEASPSALARLAALPPTAARTRLQEVVPAGVAFHSSDLQCEERRIIEEAFAGGELLILCSTSTLALGVNLPARNVVLAPERWEQPDGRGRPALVPLSRAEYENMSGRAGRPRLAETFGRSILLADSGYQQDALLARYTAPGFDPLTPALAALPPLQQLTLLCGAEGGGTEDLATLYRHTLSAWVQGEPRAPGLPPPLQAALDSAQRHGLLAPAEPDHLRVTPLGRLAATSGADLESFYWLTRWLGDAAPAGACLSLMFLVALTPETLALGFPLGPRGPQLTDWLRELSAQAPPPDQPLLSALGATSERSASDKARAARLVLALWRWMSAASTTEIEDAVHVPAGRLGLAADTVSWLVGLVARLGAERGWPDVQVQATETLAARLSLGLPEEVLPLGQALRGVAGRDRVLALWAAGLRGAADLAALAPAERRRLLPEAEATDAASGLAVTAPPTPRLRQGRVFTPAPASAAPVLALDSAQPDCVLFHGRRIPLRPLEWRLLAALAARPGRCVPYRELFAEVWGPGEVVEHGQINWHRSRLAKRLTEALPEGEVVPLRNFPRRGYCLDLAEDQVEFAGAPAS